MLLKENDISTSDLTNPETYNKMLELKREAMLKKDELEYDKLERDLILEKRRQELAMRYQSDFYTNT